MSRPTRGICHLVYIIQQLLEFLKISGPLSKN